MTNRAYAKNNGDGLLCSILCQQYLEISYFDFDLKNNPMVL